MLKDYEEEVILRMFDEELIMMNYKATERVASKIKWSEIAQKFRVKKSFQSVIRELVNKGLVTDHGKSGNVASLTQFGVSYVRSMLKK